MLKRTPTLLVLALTLMVGVLLPVGPPLSATAGNALAVIVHPSTSLTNISLARLRQTFRSEYAEDDAGKRLIPFNTKIGTSERIVFDRAVLGLEPGEVGRFWIQSPIRDEGLPPRTLPAPLLAVRVAAAYPGAITYVRVSAVTSAVRVLKVDGKSPGQPGYLFPNL